jgi:hypothetical protein
MGQKLVGLVNNKMIGAILVSGCLKSNNGIEILDLRGNNIRSDGAIAVAQMLKVNTTLKR